MKNKQLLNHTQIDIILWRLVHQIIENHTESDSTALIALQPRGTKLAEEIYKRVLSIKPKTSLKYGVLDHTFYRDDINRQDKPIIPKETSIDFNTENKHIILVDDVLYTGRSIRSALDAVNDLGRPASCELLVLVDRKYSRELPISPDYFGIAIDTRAENQKVKVQWENNNFEVWLNKKTR